MTEKEMFLDTWQREFQTTMKVLNQFPTDKKDFRPHERSRSAHELAYTFIAEQSGMSTALDGQVRFDAGPAMPSTFKECLDLYEKSNNALVSKIKALNDDTLNGTVPFPVGPNKMADFRKLDLLWTIMMDMIHHRGQFSVYLRMAGGKVPSIYGPTADEPWN